jgi:hypothetical protein
MILLNPVISNEKNENQLKIENPKESMSLDYGGYTANYDAAFSWVECNDSIYLTQLNNTNQQHQEIILPFNFTFYEINYSRIYVSNTGYVTFTNSYLNQQYIPSKGNIGRAIAPYWINIENSIFRPIKIWAKNVTAPNAVIIEWEDRYLGTLEKLGTYEIILYESGSIKFQYLSANPILNPYNIGLDNGDLLNFYTIENSLFPAQNKAIEFNPSAKFVLSNVDDVFEPNNEPNAAIELSENKTNNYYYIGLNASNHDYYSVSVNNLTGLQIFLHSMPEINYFIELLGPTGSQIGGTFSSSGNTLLEKKITQSGIYKIHIQPLNSLPGNESYTLIIKKNPFQFSNESLNLFKAKPGNDLIVELSYHHTRPELMGYQVKVHFTNIILQFNYGKWFFKKCHIINEKVLRIFRVLFY